MSTQLLEQVTQFLQALEPTQDELMALFGRKRVAMTSARPSEMVRLSQAESALTQQLQLHLSTRQQILAQAGQADLPSGSVLELVGAIGGDAREQLRRRIERAQAKSEAIRRESWVQWIVTQRAFNHYTTLLDLIANCGKKAPTYSHGPDEQTSGGAILDASI